MASSLFVVFVVVVVFSIYFSCLHGASASEFLHVQFSTISAAPAFLPQPPSPSVSPSSSPDISPLFPTPAAHMPPSPSESSMPTIPASPSPPNPDGGMLAPEPQPELAVSPAASPPPDSSSVSLTSSSVFLVHCVLLLGLVLFCPMQLSSV